MFRHHLPEHGVHVLGHAFGIAADIEMRALLQPRPELRAVLAHAVLHVDLGRLVARERQVQPCQQAVIAQRLQFVAIVEIAGRVPLAEKQPVAAAIAARPPFLQEGAERRHAGAGADHDHRRVALPWRPEVAGLLHEDRHVGGARAVGQEGRRDALALAPAVVIAHGGHRQVDLAGVRLGAGRDGVQPRLQALERAQPRLRRQPDWVRVQHVGQLLAP
ncbi:hypothetical protein LMG26842_01935 [Achromobacter dolens]|nr:hypothetical protein LMG26842_01935 [Achromobacter dolens]